MTSSQIEGIRQLHFTEKWSVREVARHMRMSRETIKKYLFSPERIPIKTPQQRTSKLDSYKPEINTVLQRDFTVKLAGIFRHLRSLGYQGERTMLRDYVRRIRTKSAARQQVFDWMRAVLQGALRQSDLVRELGHVDDLDKLLTAVTEGRLSTRNRAMAVLARERGIGQSYVSSFLYLGKMSATRYWQAYKQGGMVALIARQASRRQKSQDDETNVITAIIRGAGYKWRKARVVLTSNDPNYKVKVEAIRRVLSRLKGAEAFFSIDEYGPFAVKKKGGRKRVAPQEVHTIPQRQKSKG